MISGASQMDGAIVVVAADDGQMPQTREHLLLAKQIGIKHLIVFINKADLADKDVLELVELEMSELLDHYGFDSSKTPFIPGSALLALKGDSSDYGEPSIHRLIAAMDSVIQPPERDLKSPFFLPIDNFFTVPGRGSVVIGTLSKGLIKKGTEADLIGFDRKIRTRASAVQVSVRIFPVNRVGKEVLPRLVKPTAKPVQSTLVNPGKTGNLMTLFFIYFYVLVYHCRCII
ncbi:UNVERIFIED_CONTAM: hypothetical protein GTU68_035236 [Idotea baltica]|nr:hypothetical protein [Idotea baltica]